MRISTNEKDPGYLAWVEYQNNQITVYLNGKEIRDVITADEEKGEIVTFDTTFELQTLTGKVKIVINEMSYTL